MNKTFDWRSGLEGKIRRFADEADQVMLPSVSLIRTLRDHLSLSQADVADILGVSQPNISKLEAGRDLKISALARIVKAQGGDIRIVVDFPGGEAFELRP